MSDDATISAADFLNAFGEDVRRTLDLTTWSVGADLTQEVDRIAREVSQSVLDEEGLHAAIRERVFPMIAAAADAPKNAGKHAATKDELLKIQRGLLFRGAVEACTGALHVHDTLPLTIFQIGVTLTSYQGDRGTWFQRLFRHDLRERREDPVQQVLEVLEKRAREDSPDMGELVQKTILGYAERGILLRRSEAIWRMGRGNPVTYELLTGGGIAELMQACVNMLRELIERQRKFVFVANPPRDLLLRTIGEALRPWEFAIVSRLSDRLETWLHQKRFTAETKPLTWDDVPLPAWEWIPRFIREVASKVVVGVFRSTPLAPALVFYAHEDHADVAARLAIADGMFQEQSGFPLLLDLSSRVGSAVFGESLEELTGSAYAAAGVPFRKRGD